jgi:diacylglycerol kinase
MISPRQFSRSLRHALRGLREVANTEHSFRVQLLLGTLAIVVSLLLPLSALQRVLILLMTAAVLVLEVMNSIVERLIDAVQPRLNPMVREVKDMMAGTVLLTSISAVIVGLVIFLPYIWPFLTRLKDYVFSMI